MQIYNQINNKKYNLNNTTYLCDPLEHPGSHKQRDVRPGQDGGEHGEQGRHPQPHPEDGLTPVTLGQLASDHLGRDVAVEKGGQDQTLSARVPVKLTRLIRRKGEEKRSVV